MIKIIKNKSKTNEKMTKETKSIQTLFYFYFKYEYELYI